ncbi:MAG: branched-chain amino acid ABC transporter permease [Lachnospiraceae bacterium]|nr:branched-chain amino acid ABC transporter permease [Lachnospiraceae bacterium]
MEKKRPAVKGFSNKQYIGFIIFGLCLCLIPVLVKMGVLKTSFLNIIGGSIIYTIAALGLNILLGYAGSSSLGTAGFMGLGAYISAYMSADLGLPWELSLIIATVIPTLIGILVGVLSLKMSGLYLGIATLCVAEIFRKTFSQFTQVTGGFAGKSASFPVLFGTIKLKQTGTFVLLIVFMVLAMMLTYNLVHGQLGRALHAIRSSETAAQAMGVSLRKYRLVAFALASGYGAMAGSLYVHFVRFVYPSTWNLLLSLNILAMIVIGGMRSIYGTFIGAIIVYAVPDLILKRIPVVGSYNGFAYVFSGVLVILVIMFSRGGIAGMISGLVSKRKARPAETAAAAGTDDSSGAGTE